MRNKVLSLILLLFLLSCETTNINNIENIETNLKEDTTITPTTKLTEDELLDIRVNNYIKYMTLEEKVGQLFILDIRGYTKLDKSITSMLTTFKPGGVILFSNNIENNEQVVTLIDDIQRTTDIPMFISVDEEGGIVSRLGKAKNVSVTHLPPALTIGNKNDPTLAYNSGKILGRELKSLGFNMDMAPVSDVNTNPQNPVIGNRTYSADPYKAGEMVVNFIDGFHEENMIAVMKHFPGHGDTSTDTHLGTVVSPHNRERLDQIEFIPFKMGIESGVDVIMTAHMTMPGISTTPLPATLNPEIIQGILRDDLGFSGIVMTDALDMGAITNNFSSGNAAILGIKAGIDILLIPLNSQNAFNAIMSSIDRNEITVNRIDESVKRIIKLKMKRGLFNNTKDGEDIYTVIQDSNHQTLIKTIFNQ